VRLALAVLCCASLPLAAAEPPSHYGIDAPALAALGSYAVGVRELQLRNPAQADPLTYDATRGTAALRDRELAVELWYPAHPTEPAKAVSYQGTLPSEPPLPPARFSVPGLALRAAPPAAGRFPLVLVSHGMSNDVAALTWLTENLASKGYVVAAIRHEDPPITDRAKFPAVIYRRPLDIVFAARALQRSLGEQIDPRRIALVGYSMGGYGVLTAAGAVLDPQGGAVQMVPGGLLAQYAEGGARQSSLAVPGLKAVVAISPFGGAISAWGAHGLAAVTVPSLLIAGDEDRKVGYGAVRAIFEHAVHSHRYLLTFKGAGHSIGLNPAPASMRHRLWDQDWFEDPVWRTERVNAINAHFITAFLDRFVKDDESRAGYLDVPVPVASEGQWPDPPPPDPPPAYGAISPGTPGITVWKGFQRSQAMGLELRQAMPADAGG
jgi:predicted dienelactone hydrolase